MVSKSFFSWIISFFFILSTYVYNHVEKFYDPVYVKKEFLLLNLLICLCVIRLALKVIEEKGVHKISYTV